MFSRSVDTNNNKISTAQTTPILDHHLQHACLPTNQGLGSSLKQADSCRPTCRPTSAFCCTTTSPPASPRFSTAPCCLGYIESAMQIVEGARHGTKGGVEDPVLSSLGRALSGSREAGGGNEGNYAVQRRYRIWVGEWAR